MTLLFQVIYYKAMKRLYVLFLISCFSGFLVCNAQKLSDAEKYLKCKYVKYQNTSYGYSFEYPSVMVVKPYPIEDDPGKGVTLEDGDRLQIESWVEEVKGEETPESYWKMLQTISEGKILDHKIAKRTLQVLELNKDHVFEYTLYRYRGIFCYSVSINSKVRIDNIAEKVFNSFQTNGKNECLLLTANELQSLKARAQKAVDEYMPRQQKLFESYRKGAEEGDAHAMCRLGDCHINGIVTEKNLHEAVRWYDKAAQQEDAEGMFLLAEQLEMGDDYTVAHDEKEAERLYKEAAKKGYVDAYWRLGDMFSGENHERREGALDYYTKGADKGNVLSMLKLAESYQWSGDSIKAVKGYQWMIDYIKSLAEKGDAKGMLTLAQLYMYIGDFSFCDEDYLFKMFPEDYSKAYSLLKNVAEKGDAIAMYWLGRVLYLGSQGIAYDEKEAVEWWIKATEHNDYDSYLLLKQFAEGKNVLDFDSAHER